MKAFDLVAAQRGEPIRQSHYRDGGPYFDVRFVGVMSDGRIVVERSPNHIATTDSSFLVMAPVKRTIYANFYRTHLGCSRGRISRWFDSEDEARREAKTMEAPQFVAVPIEIEE